MARPKKWLTPIQAAKQLKLKVATVKQYVKTGRLQAGADGRVSVDSVLDYAAGVRPETEPSGNGPSLDEQEALRALVLAADSPAPVQQKILYVLDGVGVVFTPAQALDKIRELVK